MLSDDGKQMVTGASIFMLEFYKILCGCFLILFVPQDCGDNQICSISDNYHTSDSLNQAGLSFNLISFVLFFSLYIIEVQREKYCIDKLDIDPDKPNNNLDDEIEEYPILKKRLQSLNKKYYHLTFVNLFVQFINIGLSTYIVYQNNLGGVTLTPLISYVMLILAKLYNVYFVSNASLIEERMYSAYLTVNRTFNTIDSDHVKTEIKDIEENNNEEVSEESNEEVSENVNEKVTEEIVKSEDIVLEEKNI